MKSVTSAAQLTSAEHYAEAARLLDESATKTPRDPAVVGLAARASAHAALAAARAQMDAAVAN
ncbi:hypothetical protein [Labedaea rhizosphaerae]|uniref:Uncharacterized protein n=1 Tax=Labedaea rhizosphaerae TaxID=598644 RepID=A0A4R6RUC4_LABRH|nr:hypothetical protein [Labedaea rhizosphaerae]TDP90513.1 hypothetical protein EV186_11053 [Labedaea rhizosphaerae]